jgi:hypothetical protein
MTLHSEFGEIEIVDEKVYMFHSSDNVRKYDYEYDLSEEYQPSSIVGVIVDSEPAVVVGAAGGCCEIHEHSALSVGKNLYIAVANRVVCIALDPLHFRWSFQADIASCFGVYFEPRHAALLSHGEIDIVRFSEEGEVVWRSSGADIFTEGFELLSDCIRAVDFNGKEYRIDYETGEIKSQ